MTDREYVYDDYADYYDSGRKRRSVQGPSPLLNLAAQIGGILEKKKDTFESSNIKF